MGILKSPLLMIALVLLVFSHYARAQDSTTVKEYADAVFWESILKSDDPEDYKDYLEAFPDGLYSKLARRRLKALVPGSRVSPSARAPSTFCQQMTTIIQRAEEDQSLNVARVYELEDIGQFCVSNLDSRQPRITCQTTANLSWQWYIDHISKMIECFPGYPLQAADRDESACRAYNMWCDYTIKIPRGEVVKKVEVFVDFNNNRMTSKGFQFYGY